MTEYFIKSAVLTFILLFSCSLRSQSVVNAESRRMEGANNGFSGNIEAGLNFVQNTNDVFSTQNASQFQWVKNNHNILSVNALNLTVFNGSKVLNDGMQHFRYIYKLNDFISWETFAQAQYNQIIKIKGRYLLGTGPRLNVFDSQHDSLNLYIGTHYMREYEEETTGVYNRHHRLSTMLAFGWEINDKVEMNLVGYYQPDILNWNDFRVSSEVFFKIAIFKKLKFKYSMAWFYDQNPPEGIRNIFYNIRNTLLFEID